MNKEKNSYTFIFTLIVCMVCSLLISLVFEGLRHKRELNEIIDQKKNILKALAIKIPKDIKDNQDKILDLYNHKIKEVVISKEGKVIDDKKIKDIVDEKWFLPLYIYKENGKVDAYCFPIKGKGLWSTIYGYLALESDAIKVRGITFYKHGETPGLGAEIEKKWFQDQFKGKKIWDNENNRLKSVIYTKGYEAKNSSSEKSNFYVDGISGATMTSKGVANMLSVWIKKYEPFLNKIRNIR